MKMHAFSSKPLTLAVVAALATSAPAMGKSLERHFLAMVDATSLPLAADQAATLSRLFGQGSPVLVHMDARTPEDLAHVSELFGIAPTSGDMIVRNDGDAIEVFAASPESGADASALIQALVESVVAVEADAPDSAGVDPGLHIDVNLVDTLGEIAGVTRVDLVRSRTLSSDFKLITLTSNLTVNPANKGVSDGSKTGKNAWTADLPLEYRFRHTLTADDTDVTYLAHFPETDGRTEFTQTDTEIRGFTIGGSTGSEISHSGKADENLAAKVPLNLSFGHEHKWQSNLTMTFKDYSVHATPGVPGTVAWKVLIAPTLENVLVKRWGADLPVLSEDKMTPMMRDINFKALSYWKVPGSYAGLAHVTVSAGYDLDRKKWWWNRTQVNHSRERVPRDVAKEFVFDLSNPFLSPEKTVLIRSATGSGSCLRDHFGVVDLVACVAKDRSQMWGFDAASRYVNRGSGRCLAAQPATNSVVTESCENITYEKQWQWRADRLHSLIDHGRYRLYLEGGQVRYAAPEARFPDFPVNPYASALEPWTNYPSAPRAGIDHIMGPAGSRTLDVGPEYAGFPRVSDDQRWHIEVVRPGL